MFLCAVDEFSVGAQVSPVTEDVVQTVGRTIRRFRERQGYSQEAFAQKAQLDRSYFGRIERGTQNLALRTLCVIAIALEVHPAELLADVEVTFPPPWGQ